ncbi:Zn-ribbon domain-containing OB-fold protein [Gordonia sp. (in: high G+C Gram-positive bacteria)]|uniref:Zn-ribbon domain-containing OB-fold protein n=1 Tax=Gordonia sp. (in: high G+C Gram-positive bacteria) TaxID=84139 RepID=UPI003F99E7B9
MNPRVTLANLAPVMPAIGTEQFFAAAERGEFLLFRTASGDVIAPQDACGASDVTPFAASGGGRVVTSSVIYGKDGDGASTPRYTIGIVELDEGPWWWSELIVPGCDYNQQVLTGRRVSVRFVNSGDEPRHASVPVFVVVD